MKQNFKLEKMNLSESLHAKIQVTEKVLAEAFQQYKLDEIFMSFNGGKDCTVLLHLVCRMLRLDGNSNSGSTNNNSGPLTCLYVQPDKSFPEIESFVSSCEKTYNILMIRCRGGIKTALEVVCKDRPSLKACVMGSRRTDPYCEHLKTFHPTDSGWPSLMRVNPLLDWNCKDVWEYLHIYEVPFCTLYEQGYTSLGDQTNTVPNPYLKRTNSKSGEEYYLPAYKLENADELERAGRIKRNESL